MSQENRAIPVEVTHLPAGSLGPAPSVDSPEALAESPARPRAEPRVYYTPLIDIHEDPEGLVLEADLPGASEGSVSIQLEDNVLSLLARVESVAPDGARLLHEEFRVGDYYRSFILSDEVERSRITAEMKCGVLRLTLPKADRAKTRRIEIKS